MEFVAKAGLSWDHAIVDYLYYGDHEALRMTRPRPPEEKDEEDPAPVSD